MNNEFELEERLYRAVVPNDIYIKSDGSISSAAFKCSNGCSVDRGNGRTDEEAANFLRTKLMGNIYGFKVEECIKKDIFIRFEPVEDEDPYHCGLYKNSTLEKMTNGQCKHLAMVAYLIPA